MWFAARTRTLPVVREPDACTTAPYDGGQTASALNIVVADDDVLLREGLAGPLDGPGFKVVGQAGDATEVLSLLGEHRPDLVVVDIYS
jgi:PleD family two-component response regulator